MWEMWDSPTFPTLLGRRISVLTGSIQLRQQLGGVHHHHKLLTKRFCLGRLLGAESSNCLEVEQRIGLPRLAGGLLQCDPGDNATDGRQGTEQPGGVFQKPGLAGYGNTHQQRNNIIGPQQKEQHRFLAGFGVALPVLTAEIIVRTVGAGFPVIGDDAVLAHTYGRRSLDWIGRIPIGPGRHIIQNNPRQLFFCIVSSQSRHGEHGRAARGGLDNIKEIQGQRLALQVIPDDAEGIVG